MKSGGQTHGERWRARPQHRFQRRDVVSGDELQMRALVAEPGGDRLGEAHLELDGGDVLRRFGAGRQHADLACAVRQRTQPDIDSRGGHVMQLDGDDARRQAAPAPSRGVDELAAARIVEKQARVAAARGEIGGQQRAHALAQLGNIGIRIRQRAGWAHRRARAASHAQMRFDKDAVAVGAYRLGRAYVDALIATGLLRAAVGAD